MTVAFDCVAHSSASGFEDESGGLRAGNRPVAVVEDGVRSGVVGYRLFSSISGYHATVHIP
ncbi:hypothetical protein [Haloarcula rubripromontorii]|uniref:hypothetical protein n=1 Tax=Haloarcula rubripromontorii TaxID=1705562 RepID=UPI000ABFC4EC|nr:hypothetical protein [Haloarcula rubripromontorii]